MGAAGVNGRDSYERPLDQWGGCPGGQHHTGPFRSLKSHRGRPAGDGLGKNVRVRCLVPARDWVPDRAPGRDPDQHRLPPVIEARVAETAPPIHSGQDNTWKFAKLENGVEIQVPLFVGPGEIVRIDVKSGRYLERVREKRRSA